MENDDLNETINFEDIDFGTNIEEFGTKIHEFNDNIKDSKLHTNSQTEKIIEKKIIKIGKKKTI